MGIYKIIIEPKEVESLLKQHCITRGLKYISSGSTLKGISVKVLDPYWSPTEMSASVLPARSNYCTKHSLNHGKKYPSCRVVNRGNNK